MPWPHTVSPWPGVSEPLPPETNDQPAPQARVTANPEIVLQGLREQIASGKQDIDVILGAIAIAAQAVTDARGAALGMRRDGAVVCVGRSGENAPALGARLSSESGISGECLRSGRALRCDDTETDTRVDAEVCRHLGLRSIAAVPVRSRLETVGILEVFSTSERAFTEGDLAWLGNLAELADAATTQTAAVPEATSSPAPDPWPTRALTEPPEQRRVSWRTIGIAGTAVLVVLLASASWKIWRETGKPAPVAQTARPVAQDAPLETALGSSHLPKSTPERIVPVSGERGAVKERVVPASKNESDDVVVRRVLRPQSPPPPAVNDTSPAPEVAVVSDAGIPDLGTSSATIPKLEFRVSEGVTPLVLEQKIMPRYPQAAKAIGLEGAVMLQAQISESGQVEHLKVLRGHPLLANAAVDAVRRWRYRPASLNGKPVRMETNLTVTFKLP